jgi:hypothetical protein
MNSIVSIAFRHGKDNTHIYKCCCWDLPTHLRDIGAPLGGGLLGLPPNVVLPRDEPARLAVRQHVQQRRLACSVGGDGGGGGGGGGGGWLVGGSPMGCLVGCGGRCIDPDIYTQSQPHHHALPFFPYSLPPSPAPLPPISAHICPGATWPETPFRMRVARSGVFPIAYSRSRNTSERPCVAGIRWPDRTWKSSSCFGFVGCFGGGGWLVRIFGACV